MNRPSRVVPLAPMHTVSLAVGDDNIATRIDRRRFVAATGWALASRAWAQAAPAETVRVTVVGGLELSGFWPRFASAVEAATATRLEPVAVGNKEVIVPPFVARKADLLFIHGSDEVMAMLAAGEAGRITAWGANEHVIVGPEDDPAGVRQAKDGADGLQRIARAGAPFVSFDDPGSHAIVQKLWRTTGTRPGAGNWRLLDQAQRAQGIVEFAAERKAYVVVGHIPVAFGKMRPRGQAVLLKGDPAMRRPYVVVEQPTGALPGCGPTPPAVQRVVAFIASAAGQAAVQQAGTGADGQPWIYRLPLAAALGG